MEFNWKPHYALGMWDGVMHEVNHGTIEKIDFIGVGHEKEYSASFCHNYFAL